jgi:outer membrane lipoprotein-sorting protein
VAKTAENGLVDLTLTPRTEGDVESVAVLATPSGEVRRLVVLDGEGNRTTFTFTNLAPRAKRPLSDFALVPPKGTRVVGE